MPTLRNGIESFRPETLHTFPLNEWLLPTFHFEHNAYMWCADIYIYTYVESTAFSAKQRKHDPWGNIQCRSDAFFDCLPTKGHVRHTNSSEREKDAIIIHLFFSPRGCLSRVNLIDRPAEIFSERNCMYTHHGWTNGMFEYILVFSLRDTVNSCRFRSYFHIEGA